MNTLIGKKFGRLTVLELYNKLRRRNSRTGKYTYRTMYSCLCECGNKVVVEQYKLKCGHTKSCGCLRKDVSRKTQTKHGHRYSRLYVIWNNMKKRCYNPKNKSFKDYGGRGIEVCDEWKTDFSVFYTWAINNGYNDTLTIDRINNDGNYEPNNCRWATKLEQNKNTRHNRLITLDGITKCISDWAKEYKLNYNTLIDRLNRGWSEEKAIKTPNFNKEQVHL